MTNSVVPKGMAVNLRSGKSIVLTLDKSPDVDTEKMCIRITLEAKAGQVARLHVVAPQVVKIGLD